MLANIALNGIEEIHHSIRYADDMVFVLKPKDDATAILGKVTEFLAARGLKVKGSGHLARKLTELRARRPSPSY